MIVEFMMINSKGKIVGIIDQIIAHNAEFIKNREYKNFITDKFPNKKLAILSCMDTRLTELLPAALNIKNGDVKIIKNAGAIISHPFGSVMRSLLIAVYELGVQDIMIIGHTSCGMQNLDTGKIIDKMLERGVPKEKINMLEYCNINIHNWLKGFENVEDSVKNTARIVREHVLMPKDVNVHAFIIDIDTGELERLD